MKIFMKFQIIRCMAIVGGLALLYLFLMFINSNAPIPTVCYALFGVSYPSYSICCRSNDSLFLTLLK